MFMQMTRKTVVLAVAMSVATVSQVPAWSDDSAPSASTTAPPVADGATPAASTAPAASTSPAASQAEAASASQITNSTSAGVVAPAATPAPDPRFEEIRILQVVLQNIHAPGKNELNSSINADTDMQKAFQAIDKNLKLNEAAKKAQKDAYVHKRQRKSERFNQLLQEKRIDWYQSYLDTINNELHNFWSPSDYKDAEALSRLLNSRSVQAVKEMGQTVSDPVRSRLRNQILQLVDMPATGTVPSGSTDSQAVATKVATVKKVLDSLHSSINMEELLDTDELINPEGKPAGDAKVQKFRQLVTGGKVDLLNMYLAANVEEFDKSWSAEDYKDLENLCSLAASKVFKTLEDGGAVAEAVDHAVQRLPSILAPVKTQILAEEKAGKFDPPAAVSTPIQK